MITVSLLQLGLSLSSLAARLLKYSSIIELLELAYANERYTFPRVSSPRIIVTLGEISNLATELVLFRGCHFILRKSLIPSQVSSTFKNTFFFLACAKNSRAHRCRRTRFFSELEWSETVLIFLYLIPRSYFITDLTSRSVDSMLWCSFTCFLIYAALSIITLLVLSCSTCSLMTSLL